VNTWQPITASELSELVSRQLTECEPGLRKVFEQYRVEPYRAPFASEGALESAFVVAKRGNDVLYFEDVEEGFNTSPLSKDGRILEHWCNQDELKFALRKWQ
jgi:hypothetical protein